MPTWTAVMPVIFEHSKNVPPDATPLAAPSSAFTTLLVTERRPTRAVTSAYAFG